MSILKKLFSYITPNNEISRNGYNNSQTGYSMNYEIDENTFSDNGHAEKVVIPEQCKTALSMFLDIDFYLRGYNDGYDYASAEVYNKILESIKIEFKITIEKMIDKSLNEIAKLNELINNIKDLKSMSEVNALNRINELNIQIQKLNEQKVLCDQNDGLVMKPVNMYKAGYEKGLYAYTQEKLLGIPSGLF
ncbi:MAG: hypothetical protein HGGPFJEG_01893 [Ignavibacteria bacterium]|nr:hypothetical protein [Ignavibacteria bacterium]